MFERERPDAREFWGSGAIGPPTFPSYQFEHQAEFWDHIAEKAPAWSQAGDFSNDPLLADLWQKLLDLSPPQLASRLAGIFVAKRPKWASQASIWASPHQFAGAVIDFNVGFSDATLQFATFFERTLVAEAVVQRMDEARRMAYVADFWRETGEVFVGDYGFTAEDITPRSVGLSLLGDVWCLAHEAAHRLLGHVEGMAASPLDDFETALGDLAGAFEEEGGDELHADALATYLLRGHDPYDPDGQAAFEACIGSHLALGVLKLGDADPERGDADHPPIGRRLAFNAHVQERLTGGAYTPSVRQDFESLINLVDATIAAATAREAAESADQDG